MSSTQQNQQTIQNPQKTAKDLLNEWEARADLRAKWDRIVAPTVLAADVYFYQVVTTRDGFWLNMDHVDQMKAGQLELALLPPEWRSDFAFLSSDPDKAWLLDTYYECHQQGRNRASDGDRGDYTITITPQFIKWVEDYEFEELVINERGIWEGAVSSEEEDDPDSVKAYHAGHWSHTECEACGTFKTFRTAQESRDWWATTDWVGTGGGVNYCGACDGGAFEAEMDRQWKICRAWDFCYECSKKPQTEHLFEDRFEIELCRNYDVHGKEMIPSDYKSVRGQWVPTGEELYPDERICTCPVCNKTCWKCSAIAHGIDPDTLPTQPTAKPERSATRFDDLIEREEEKEDTGLGLSDRVRGGSEEDVVEWVEFEGVEMSVLDGRQRYQDATAEDAARLERFEDELNLRTIEFVCDVLTGDVNRRNRWFDFLRHRGMSYVVADVEQARMNGDDLLDALHVESHFGAVKDLLMTFEATEGQD